MSSAIILAAALILIAICATAWLPRVLFVRQAHPHISIFSSIDDNGMPVVVVIDDHRMRASVR